jgi:uncharacterized membrane protein
MKLSDRAAEMKQDDINEIEWRNPANWTWRGPLGLYASRRDARPLVPKSMPMMGWTLNFGHPGLTGALVALAALALVLAVAQHLFP